MTGVLTVRKDFSASSPQKDFPPRTSEEQQVGWTHLPLQ
jgi:hypothetical protein